MLKEEYCNLFRYIGEAALALHMENSHSGNISMMAQTPEQAESILYITKTGTKLGHLKPRDICSPGLDKVTFGVFQSSSETNIHRGILKHAKSAMHAHIFMATLLSYIQDSIQPIDKFGLAHLGAIPAVRFEFPVGSQEMVDKIPPLLKDAKVMIVKTHGAFGRGDSMKEVFYNICLAEYSAQVLFFARMLDACPVRSPQQGTSNGEASNNLPPYTEALDNRCDTDDEEIIRQFRENCEDIFYLELSPFHTGSASVRDGATMLYTPKASAPEGLPGPILRIDIKPGAKVSIVPALDMEEIETHRAIYAHSRVNAILHTLSPLATAQAFQSIEHGSDRIIPVDAEGGYLYPAIPVLDNNSNNEDLTDKLVKYKMVVVKGEGIWSGGATLGYTLHHPSSAKNISFFRNYLSIMHKLGLGCDIKSQECEKGKEW